MNKAWRYVGAALASGLAVLAWSQPIPTGLVTPVQAQEPGPPAISLNFQNTDIRALMQVFADFTGLNFVTTDSVIGQVSVRLQDVPWPQALEVVLQA